MGSRAVLAVLHLRWILVVGLLWLGGLAHADGRLPGVVADSLYRASALLKEQPGDVAAAESALTMLEPHQAQALPSLSYWTTYLDAWKAAGRDETAFWTTLVGPLQAANPKCATFDLVRANQASDPKQKRAHVEAAIGKNPKGVAARLMLARIYLAEDNLDDADALLDELLEDAPDDRGVLLAKGDIYIQDGMGKSAVRVADKGLESWGEDASFYDLKARAAKVRARRDSKHLATARAAAAKAVELEPSPAHVETFVDVLKSLGERDEAVRVLDEKFRLTGSPVLGAMLGSDAFEQGDYLTAIRTMAPAIETKLAYAKAHAVSLARTAQTELAKQALASVVARDAKWADAARRLLFLAGDAQGALEGAPKGEVAERLWVARIHAWLGDSERVVGQVGETLKAENRKSEDAFLYLLMARVLEAMGPDKAQALRSQIVELRGKIGRRARKLETRPKWYKGGKATHEAYAIRAVSYFLTPDGAPFEPVGEIRHTSTWNIGNGVSVFSSTGYWQVEGRSTKDEKFTAWFRFNEGKTASSGVIEFPGGRTPPKPDEPSDDDEKDDEKGKPKKKAVPKTFSDAVNHLDAAAGAVLTGNYAEALLELDKSLVIEPHWARVAVFRAAVRALGGKEPERAMAGREARRIHEAFPDDLQARELATFLDYWAGMDPEEDIREIEKRRATRNQRDIKKL